ncbi:helix-turn-helix domain-containing protein [Corynebacterium lubricantis]|uniref:helix-turn-helix domain-containing protein n=1 Tax=Corynebacterium lubricantis TaxID=541095 RepID=UPI00037E5553|nr:helix-turn-helix domain-containing protein [Corynebacterium lubricantis]
MATHDPYINGTKAADYAGCSARTLRRRVAEGKLTAYRSGRIVRYKKSDLDAMFTRTDTWAVN